MKRTVLIFLILPIITLSQNKDYKNFDKAVKYNVEGKINKSIKYANKALKNNPRWSQPNLLLSTIYAKNQKVQLAAEYLLKVYDENNPNDTKGIEEVVKLFYSNGFYSEALFYAEKIFSHDTNTYNTNSLIGRYIKNCKFAIKAKSEPVEFNIQNLGININTNNEEYLPAISTDGKTLVFSRKIKKNNYFQEDFFTSKIDENNIWSISKPFGNNLNTAGNEGAFSFSPNMNIAVFTACDRFDRIGSCDLYLLINTNVTNAGEIVNSEKWDSQGCFSPDGKYLYFVSNRDGGYGGKDIWRSEITNQGFEHPENVGPSINTKYDEMSPFLHSDNLTLYFASNGHIGMGDFDMYVSRRINSINEWKTPKNLGYPINTHKTENSLVVANDGKTAYYTSDNSGFGLEDIFVFQLPKSIQATEVSDLEIDIITQKNSGEFILKDVSFDSNSSTLNESSYIVLDKLILYLIKNPDIKLEVQGHTDDIGSNYDNLILSQERAKVVYDYLIKRIDNTISFKGYGETKPIINKQTGSARKINRRTSIVIQ